MYSSIPCNEDSKVVLLYTNYQRNFVYMATRQSYRSVGPGIFLAPAAAILWSSEIRQWVPDIVEYCHLNG